MTTRRHFIQQTAQATAAMAIPGSDGSCKETDFKKIMAIVEKYKTKAFKGYVGFEYEGGFLRMMNPKENYLPEDKGIKATKKLLM